MNAVTLNRSNLARINGRNALSKVMFIAAVSALAAVGCGGNDSTTLGGVGTAGAAGTTGVPSGIAGTGTPAAAAGTGTPTGVAGTAATPPTAVAGTAATAGNGAANMAGIGAANMAGVGAAAAAGTGGAATGGTGMMATAGAGPAVGGATLTAVFAIVQANCVACHGMPSKDTANGNLGMIKDKAQFYAAVVSKPTQGVANMCMGKGMYVVPGNPAMSMLLQKTVDSPPCGAQMPPGNPLSPADTKTISDWIMAGAPNN